MAADACGDDVLRLVLRGGPPAWRAVCTRWRAAYDDGAAHVFATSRTGRGYFALRPGNAYARLCDHHAAARLGFGHASVGAGAQRHVVLWHPRGGGPCALFLRVADGAPSAVRAVRAVRAELAPTGGERRRQEVESRRGRGRKRGREFYADLRGAADEEEDDDDDDEYGVGDDACIKCGLRTTRTRCPDCGRPTWCPW